MPDAATLFAPFFFFRIFGVVGLSLEQSAYYAMIVITLLLLMLSLAGCDTQPSPAAACRREAAPERQAWDNERHPLYGDVESLCTLLYQYKSDGSGRRLERVDTVQYALFNFRGDLLSRRVAGDFEHAVYDARHRLVAVKRYDADSLLLSERRLSYDALDRVSEELTVDAGGAVRQHLVNVYNTDNQLIRQDEQDASGRVVAQRHNSYLDTLLVESRGYHLGSFVGSVLYRYDDEDRLAEQCFYMENNSIGGRRTYSYDAAGNILSESLFEGDSEQPVLRYDYRYDSRGNRTEWHHLYPSEGGDMVLREYYRYSYDDEGNVILTESFFNFAAGEQPSAATLPDARLEVHLRYRN